MTLTQISTAGVKDDAVTSGKIPANAVGSSELADNAVDTAAIVDDAVTAAKLASNAVVNASVDASAAIARTKLANVDVVDDTSPQLGGNLDTNTKNIFFGDSSSSSNNRLQFGATDKDLQLYHNGTDSYISEAGTGNLILGTGGSQVHIHNTTNDEPLAKFISNGAVELYYDNSKKFETVSGGATLTGNLDVTSGDVKLLTDNKSIQFGASADLTVKHSGSTGVIDNITGDLHIKTTGSGDDIVLISNDDIELQPQAGEAGIKVIGNGSVELYHNNSIRAYTASDGFALSRVNTFPNPNNTGSEITGALLDIGGNLHLEERYPNGAYSDRQDLVLRTNSGYGQGQSDKIRFQSNGDIQLLVSGTGINFHPQGASAANLLDDYEEGTWGPVPSDGNNTFNYGQEYGSYTKIGNVIHVSYAFNASLPSTSGYALFINLPFQVKDPSNNTNEGIGYSKGTGVEIQLEAQQGQSRMKLRSPSSGAALTPNNVGMTNNVTKTFRGAITYLTT